MGIYMYLSEYIQRKFLHQIEVLSSSRQVYQLLLYTFFSVAARKRRLDAEKKTESNIRSRMDRMLETYQDYFN